MTTPTTLQTYKADLEIPTRQYGFILLKDVEGTLDELLNLELQVKQTYDDLKEKIETKKIEAKAKDKSKPPF